MAGFPRGGRWQSPRAANGRRHSGKEWQRELQRSRSKSLNAPSWLWTSLIELLADW